MGQSVATNVNGGSTDAQITAAQQEHGDLSVSWWTLDDGSGELDCGTLIYCSAGGTGKLKTDRASFAASQHFPECCDPDKDGLGTLTPTVPPFVVGPSQEIWFMHLYPGATAGQIQAGDVLIEHGTLHGETVESATAVGFVSATYPVLAAYSDGQGNSGFFSYPHSSPPVPVRAGPDGKVRLRLTFWRPQRPRISGDPGTGAWIDVGNLAYATSVALPFVGPPAPTSYGTCPESSYSEMDPNLMPLAPTFFSRQAPPTLGEIRYLDHRGDQPSSVANTFTYSLDVSDCLAARGASVGAGEMFSLQFFGFGLADNGSGGEKTETMLSSQADFVLEP